MANRLYAQGRLYSAPTRLTSLDFSDRVDGWIDEGAFQNLTAHCYLPYRDDGENVHTEEDYFKADVNAINNSIGVAGFFDGATFDSGSAFEIGYAHSKGLPVHLITTDFFQYYAGNSDEYYSISKLAQHIAKVVAIWEPDTSISGYREQNQDILERAFDALRINLTEDYGPNAIPKSPLTPLPVAYDYYLDPNFNYTEPSRWLLEKITAEITSIGKTYILGNNMGDIDADIINLRQSGQAIFYSDVFEPNVDSGILHGIAYGISRKPIVYCSKWQRFHSGLADDYLNGMIRYSAAAVVKTFDELRKLIVDTVDYTRHEETDRFRYSGIWSTRDYAQFSNGVIMETFEDGAALDFAFYGTAFRIIGYKSQTQNTFDVYIDEEFITNVDTYFAGAYYHIVVYESDQLVIGSHKVRLVAHTTDSIERNRITVDAIEVKGNLLNTWEID